MSSMLNQNSLFIADHTIYWPEKYEQVVEYLKNGTGTGTNHQSLYKMNVEVIVLAACIGLKHNNALDLPSEKKEIALSTFNQHGFGVYLFLIPMLSEKQVSVDYFRNKDEEKRAISIFEKYAAGGLEILNERLVTRSMDSPYLFTSDLLSNRGDDIREVSIELF